MSIKTFLDNNGVNMSNDKSDNFGSHFDWVVTANTVIKNNIIPKTIYIKTDYLPRFVKDILPSLKEEFILINGCSDYSASINFVNEYNTIINHPYLKMWYTNNRISLHQKMKAYPGGMCSYSHESFSLIMDILLSYRTGERVVKKTNDKVLCVWRDRNGNICGDQYSTRSSVKKFIESYPNVFEWVDPSLDYVDFYEVMSNYKYVLCPVGNGIDPSPKFFEAIILKTIPIIIRTTNTVDFCRDDFPCILVDDFEEILVEGFLEKKYEELKDKLESPNILYNLSCEYWANKIKSHFQ